VAAPCSKSRGRKGSSRRRRPPYPARPWKGRGGHRIYKPPLTRDLLHAEEAGSLDFGRLIAAVLTVAESAGREALLFIRPIALELLDALDFTQPIRMGPLPEFIDHRKLLQNLGAGVLFGEADGANLDHRMIER